MPKLGRPYKRTGTKKQNKQREVWRKHSHTHYWKNRKKILKKAKKKRGKK